MAGKHSVIVGGSSAGRILFCPASYQEQLRLPDRMLGGTSSFAEEGTAMHAVMEHLFQPGNEDITPESLIGKRFHDRDLTFEHVETMINPALDALDELCEAYGGGFEVYGSPETEVHFPGIPGAFGTIDLTLVNETHVILADWKFGAGVGVKAVYSDPSMGDYVNPQLAFYLTAALNTLPPKTFAKRKLVVAVIQPREPMGDTLTHTEVKRAEVRAFREALTEAVVEALGRNPHRERGPHCAFQACRATCSLWTGPVLDATALGVVKPVAPVPGAPADEFGTYLANAKRLLDLVKPMSGEIDTQIHRYLEAGGVVPGYRLKDKVLDRKWTDPAKVAPVLKGLGFKDEEIYQPKKLVTFKIADAAAKRLGVEIPAELRPRPVSSETTVTTVDDAAPPASRGAALTAFGQSLKAIAEGQLS